MPVTAREQSKIRTGAFQTYRGYRRLSGLRQAERRSRWSYRCSFGHSKACEALILLTQFNIPLCIVSSCYTLLGYIIMHLAVLDRVYNDIVLGCG